MKKPTWSLVYYIICFLILSSCQEYADLLDEEGQPVTSEEILPLATSFEKEGAKRGISIDLKEKGIYIVLGQLQNAVGNCSYTPEGLYRKIIIDEDYWAKATHQEREWVVFHELGHCYLERTHYDATDKGVCISMMNSGKNTRCVQAYNNQTRTYYINELFGATSQEESSIIN